MDAGIDDVAAGQMDPAGDPVEQPRMVGRDYGHQRRPTRGVIFGVDVERLALGPVELGQVHRDDIVRLGDPVGVVELLGIFADQLAVRSHPLGHHTLLGRDPLDPAALDMAQPQAFFGGFVKLMDQLALPAIPHPRPDRANIDDGQHCQQPQPLNGLDLGDKIGDRFPVSQIAFEGDCAHQQMVAHQPGDQVAFLFGHSEPRAQFERHFCTEHRMIAAPPFGDIVEQDRDIERAALGDLVDDRAGQRVVGLHVTLFDLGHQPDRADGVLVDRIVVVHVELHLGVDPAEIGHEPAEHPGFVEPAQRRFGIIAAGQQVHEGSIGPGIFAHRIDQPRIAHRQPHRIGVQFQPCGVGQNENLDQADRVLREPIV